jgi:hypothetical protein
MAGNKQAPEFGTFYAWMNGCGEYGCPLSSKPCLEEVDIMSCTQQESREASETIDTCIEELTELIATFRMYGGRLVDIDRGDFDIDFFKGLHTKCSNIYNKLFAGSLCGLRRSTETSETERGRSGKGDTLGCRPDVWNMVGNRPSSILANPDELPPTEKGNEQGVNVVVHGTDVLLYLLGANSPFTLRYPYVDRVREHVFFYGSSMSLCNGPHDVHRQGTYPGLLTA